MEKCKIHNLVVNFIENSKVEKIDFSNPCRQRKHKKQKQNKITKENKQNNFLPKKIKIEKGDSKEKIEKLKRIQEKYRHGISQIEIEKTVDAIMHKYLET